MKRRGEELEEHRLKQEEKMAAEERGRDRAFSTSMTEMVKMMTVHGTAVSSILSTFSHGYSAARTITASTSLPLGISANALSTGQLTTPSYHSCITWQVLAQVRRKTNQQCLTVTL